MALASHALCMVQQYAPRMACTVAHGYVVHVENGTHACVQVTDLLASAHVCVCMCVSSQRVMSRDNKAEDNKAPESCVPKDLPSKMAQGLRVILPGCLPNDDTGVKKAQKVRILAQIRTHTHTHTSGEWFRLCPFALLTVCFR